MVSHVALVRVIEKKKYYFMNVAALNRVMTTLLTTKLSELRTLLKSETFFFDICCNLIITGYFVKACQTL